MLFSDIPRVRLISAATPLDELSSFSNSLDKNRIFMKHDELMPLGMGGNKLRSLEFWLGEAIKQQADVILVEGQPRSNLCRLTAAACAKLSLPCVIIHNADEAAYDLNCLTGNEKLNKLMGTETVFCGYMDDDKRRDFVLDYADSLKKKGKTPYIIADEIIGALGYVAAAIELCYQADKLNIPIKHIFISASAGPTETGLVFGLCLFGQVKVHLVSVEYSKAEFFKIFDAIFTGLCKKLKIVPAVNPHDLITFYEDYLGEGYAAPTKSSIEAVKRLASSEGIFIETTYNAKVLDCLVDLIEAGNIPGDEAVCFYNTGGIPAIFSQKFWGDF